MNKNELKSLIKEVMAEEQDYNKLFLHMLDKTHKSLKDMSDMEKKHFFNAVDKAYKAKSEGRLTGLPEELTDKQKQLDIDGDGEIEGSDLKKLRAQNEVGTNDWHFKAIMKMYDMASPYGRKKISAAATAKTNASRKDIERELRDTDYDEITDISAKLGLRENAEKKK